MEEFKLLLSNTCTKHANKPKNEKTGIVLLHMVLIGWIFVSLHKLQVWPFTKWHCSFSQDIVLICKTYLSSYMEMNSFSTVMARTQKTWIYVIIIKFYKIVIIIAFFVCVFTKIISFWSYVRTIRLQVRDQLSWRYNALPENRINDSWVTNLMPSLLS